MAARLAAVPSLAQMPRFGAVARTRLADRAYAALLQKIVTGEIAEGQPLPTEAEMCLLFEVSRPVVREALGRLRKEGLVASRRGSGSFVQTRAQVDVSTREVAQTQQRLLENLEFRSVIEPQAALRAAERRTPLDLRRIEEAVDRYEEVALRQGAVGDHLDFGFHLAVAEASHNGRFVEAISTVQHDIEHGVNLVRYLGRFDPLERSRSVHADHSRILSAIRDERPEDARIAMQVHLEHARLRMVHSRPLLPA